MGRWYWQKMWEYWSEVQGSAGSPSHHLHPSIIHSCQSPTCGDPGDCCSLLREIQRRYSELWSLHIYLCTFWDYAICSRCGYTHLVKMFPWSQRNIKRGLRLFGLILYYYLYCLLSLLGNSQQMSCTWRISFVWIYILFWISLCESHFHDSILHIHSE